MLIFLGRAANDLTKWLDDMRGCRTIGNPRVGGENTRAGDSTCLGFIEQRRPVGCRQGYRRGPRRVGRVAQLGDVTAHIRERSIGDANLIGQLAAPIHVRRNPRDV